MICNLDIRRIHGHRAMIPLYSTVYCVCLEYVGLRDVSGVFEVGIITDHCRSSLINIALSLVNLPRYVLGVCAFFPGRT